MLRRASEIWQEKTQGFREAGTLLALTVMIICLAVLSDNFLTPFNLLNVMRQTAEVAVIAVGMTFLIICRQFDLSVGSTFGLAAVFIGVLVRDLGFGMWPAFFCALLLGALIGLINGLFITRLKNTIFYRNPWHDGNTARSSPGAGRVAIQSMNFLIQAILMFFHYVFGI